MTITTKGHPGADGWPLVCPMGYSEQRQARGHCVHGDHVREDQPVSRLVLLLSGYLPPSPLLDEQQHDQYGKHKRECTHSNHLLPPLRCVSRDVTGAGEASVAAVPDATTVHDSCDSYGKTWHPRAMRYYGCPTCGGRYSVKTRRGGRGYVKAGPIHSLRVYWPIQQWRDQVRVCPDPYHERYQTWRPKTDVQTTPTSINLHGKCTVNRRGKPASLRRRSTRHLEHQSKERR